MKNSERLYKNITSDLKKLYESTKKISTNSIMGWIYSYSISRANSDKDEILHSPAKQLSFLIGVVLSTPEPQMQEELDKDNWEKILELLNDIFNHYWLLYIPEKGKKEKEEWWHKREVSLQAFFNFFDSGLLASVEQVKDRIGRYLKPFNEKIEEFLGISLEKCIEISDYISVEMQNLQDEIFDIRLAEDKLRQDLIDRHMGKDWSIEKMREEAESGPYLKLVESLYEKMSQLGFVDLKKVKDKFKDDGEIYCTIFSISRGDGPKINYPTETSVFEAKSIVLVNDEKAICPIPNSLYFSILTIAENIILSSEEKGKYFRARDKELEKETYNVLYKIVSKEAKIFASVYETNDSHLEHDIIIDDRYLTLVVEIKASPPIEPLRDPEKAYIRLNDAFKSDTGIQKAFDQANRLIRRLKNEKEVSLFDRKGKHICQLNYDSNKVMVGICVTRDNFGSLATDLSLLLEKEESDSYPWAISILDLLNFVDAWQYLKKSDKDFADFLIGRINLHGKVYANDELEFVGYFLQHGGFGSLNNYDVDRMQLNPHYADIFNDIYYAQYKGGDPVEVEIIKEPVVLDLKKSLYKEQPVYVNENFDKKSRKIGRNGKCPCGSGRKYKFCCGR